MSDASLAPSPYTHDEWVRRTGHMTNVAVLGGLGLLTVGAGLSLASGSIVVSEQAGAFAIDVAPTALFGGGLLSALGVDLGLRGYQQYREARLVRRAAESRTLVGSAFVTVLASTVLKTLEAARESEEGVE